jgi:acetyl-CoA synthetase
VTRARFEFGGEIAWRPTAEQIGESRLSAFMQRHGVANYEELLRRSTSDPEWFWSAVLDDLGIEFYEPYTRILDTSRGMAWPRWCVDGRLNIVHSCLDRWLGTPVAHRVAVRWEGEEGATRSLTYEELLRGVNQCAAGLRALGVGKGDRVALFMPMCGQPPGDRRRRPWHRGLPRGDVLGVRHDRAHRPRHPDLDRRHPSSAARAARAHR